MFIIYSSRGRWVSHLSRRSLRGPSQVAVTQEEKAAVGILVHTGFRSRTAICEH